MTHIHGHPKVTICIHAVPTQCNINSGFDMVQREVNYSVIFTMKEEAVWGSDNLDKVKEERHG